MPIYCEILNIRIIYIWFPLSDLGVRGRDHCKFIFVFICLFRNKLSYQLHSSHCTLLHYKSSIFLYKSSDFRKYCEDFILEYCEILRFSLVLAISREFSVLQLSNSFKNVNLGFQIILCSAFPVAFRILGWKRCAVETLVPHLWAWIWLTDLTLFIIGFF